MNTDIMYWWAGNIFSISFIESFQNDIIFLNDYLYLFDRAKIKLMKPLNSSYYYYYYYYYYCAESPLGKNNCQGYTTLGFSEVHSGMLPWWCGSSRRNNRYWSHFVVRSRPAKMEIVDPMNSNSISTIVLRRSVTFVITATYYVSLYISWICSSR